MTMHEGPVPEVEGPNSYPDGPRFDTSTESYAAGWPDTPVITESAKKARARMTAGRIIENVIIDDSDSEQVADRPAGQLAEVPVPVISPLEPPSSQVVDKWLNSQRIQEAQLRAEGRREVRLHPRPPARFGPLS